MKMAALAPGQVNLLPVRDPGASRKTQDEKHWTKSRPLHRGLRVLAKMPKRRRILAKNRPKEHNPADLQDIHHRGCICPGVWQSVPDRQWIHHQADGDHGRHASAIQLSLRHWPGLGALATLWHADLQELCKLSPALHPDHGHGALSDAIFGVGAALSECPARDLVYPLAALCECGFSGYGSQYLDCLGERSDSAENPGTVLFPAQSDPLSDRAGIQLYRQFSRGFV